MSRVPEGPGPAPSLSGFTQTPGGLLPEIPVLKDRGQSEEPRRRIQQAGQLALPTRPLPVLRVPVRLLPHPSLSTERTAAERSHALRPLSLGGNCIAQTTPSPGLCQRRKEGPESRDVSWSCSARASPPGRMPVLFRFTADASDALPLRYSVVFVAETEPGRGPGVRYFIMSQEKVQVAPPKDATVITATSTERSVHPPSWTSVDFLLQIMSRLM